MTFQSPQQLMAAQCDSIAPALDDIWPNVRLLSDRDKGKLYRHIKQAKMSLKMAYLGNSDRLDRTMRSIERIQGISPKALDGGEALKTQMLNALWSTYYVLESKGTDDAHWNDSDAPQPKYLPIVSDHQRGQGWVFYKPHQKLEKPEAPQMPSEQREALARAYLLFK